MLDQLMEAHVGNDPKPLDNVIGLLAGLQDAWQQAIVKARQEGVL